MVKKLHSEIRVAQQRKEKDGSKHLFDQKVFGKNLRTAREGHYTQSELAEEAKKYGKVKLSESTIKACESGKSNISAQGLYVLSDILNTSMDSLVSNEFKVIDSKNEIATKTGLSEKSVKYLINKKNEKKRIKNSLQKAPNIDKKVYNLNEIDAINYLLENSNIFKQFINYAKMRYFELLQLEKHNDSKTKELKEIYINLCKEKNIDCLNNDKFKQYYNKVCSTENTDSLKIKDLKILYKELNKTKDSKNIEDLKAESKIRRLENEIKRYNEKQNEFIDSSVFSMYNSISKDFKKYIKILKTKNDK